MAHAAYVGLDDYLHYRRDFEQSHKLTDDERKACRAKEAELGAEAWPGEWLALRPDSSQIEVKAMFTQAWGSTALGFGGIGGAAVTEAYTVVLQGPTGDLAVYFGGRLAYKLARPRADTPQNAVFREDLARCMLADVKTSVARYGATVPASPRLKKASAKKTTA